MAEDGEGQGKVKGFGLEFKLSLRKDFFTKMQPYDIIYINCKKKIGVAIALLYLSIAILF